MSFIKRNFIIAFKMIIDPWNTLREVDSETLQSSIQFILIIGAVTALLTPFQIYLGFEDVNGLHAGGQAEYLARDFSSTIGLGVEWRPLLIETFYIIILLFSTVYLHIIIKIVGGKGSIKDTLKMIAFGDAPGLLFGWIPYFATVSAIWAAVIQLLIGPIVLHKLSTARATIIFNILIGIGIIEIALT